MSASYDSALPCDKDWVRFLVGDRDVDNAVILQDEEIEAVLASEPNKYYAAALCGDMIVARGKGVIDKAVGDLRIKYDTNDQESVYSAHLKRLRERGAEELLNTHTSHVMFSI